MNRKELEAYIFQAYRIVPDHPFSQDDVSAVFRHADSRKWFALAMNIPRKKLGLPEDGRIDIVNLKCDPILSGSFRKLSGIFPAYHMNKTLWLTAALDGTVSDETLKTLLDMSYCATADKKKR